jgi:hypothetical protein
MPYAPEGATVYLQHAVPLLGDDRELTTIQQPLLSNGSANKLVSTATRDYSNNVSGAFYAVRDEKL